jgi:phosphoribosyl 1,2-cyclic phosphodiesterase
VDSGLSLKELGRRLGMACIPCESLDAVILSHEHVDHVRGVGALHRRYGTRVYASRGTMEAGRHLEFDAERFVSSGEELSIGELRVRPFTVPHDAREPLGFTISDGEIRVGIATDLGSVTQEVIQGLSSCQVVILESNHDEEMLLGGPYPQFLKRRVGGPEGHLSNDDAAALIEEIYHRDLLHLVLAHLSRSNNLPELPISTAKRSLGNRGGRVQVSIGRHDQVDRVIAI